MIRKFINFLGIATSVAILASCSGATESLEDNQVETKQETAVEAKNYDIELARLVAESEIIYASEFECSKWTNDSIVTDIYPVYVPGIDGIAYYECKVETNGDDAGYVLVSNTENDIKIPEARDTGITLTETYQNALGIKDFKMLRFDWFTSAAESVEITRSTETGHLLASIGIYSDELVIEEQSRSENTTLYQEYKNTYIDDIIENGAVPPYTKESMEKYYKNSGVSRGGKSVKFEPIKKGKLYELKNKFYLDDTNNKNKNLKNGFKKKVISYSTPRWNQYKIDGYPAGCGTVAWAILYGYWHQFKGKNKIFDNLDLNTGIEVTEINNYGKECEVWRPYSHRGGAKNDIIMNALEDIADYCGAEKGENCNSKYRLIWPYLKPGIATGIEYAREKGYKASVNYYTLAFDWQGATDRIISEMKNDRPVILYFDAHNDEYQIGKFHYAVVTGAGERYWDCSGAVTELRMNVNDGWGKDSDRMIYAFTDEANKKRTTNCFDYWTVNIKEYIKK